MSDIILKPIGFVKTKAVGNEIRDRDNVSQIVFRRDLVEALEGIEGFSHLFVIFWMIRSKISRFGIAGIFVHILAERLVP